MDWPCQVVTQGSAREQPTSSLLTPLYILNWTDTEITRLHWFKSWGWFCKGKKSTRRGSLTNRANMSMQITQHNFVILTWANNNIWFAVALKVSQVGLVELLSTAQCCCCRVQRQVKNCKVNKWLADSQVMSGGGSVLLEGGQKSLKHDIKVWLRLQDGTKQFRTD